MAKIYTLITCFIQIMNGVDSRLYGYFDTVYCK